MFRYLALLPLFPRTPCAAGSKLPAPYSCFTDGKVKEADLHQVVSAVYEDRYRSLYTSMRNDSCVMFFSWRVWFGGSHLGFQVGDVGLSVRGFLFRDSGCKGSGFGL